MHPMQGGLPGYPGMPQMMYPGMPGMPPQMMQQMHMAGYGDFALRRVVLHFTYPKFLHTDTALPLGETTSHHSLPPPPPNPPTLPLCLTRQ